MSAHPVSRDGILEAFLSPATAATHTLVAAAGTGNKIQVMALALVAGGANTVTMKSATTAIGPEWDLAVNGGLVLPYNPNGWFTTAANEVLAVTLSAAQKVGVHVIYRLVR